MDCQRYKDWLGDKALGALDQAGEVELRAHLERCSECRAALERERLLLAAIDRGIGTDLKADLSPDFPARVRARLAEEAAQPRFTLARWIPAAAAALAVVVLAVVWIVLRPADRHVVPSSPQTATATKARPQTPLGHTPAPETTQASAIPNQARVGLATPRRPAGTIRKASSAQAEPEVLIDKGEQESLAQLYRAIRGARVDVASLAAEPAGLKRDANGSLVPVPLEIQPLEIAELDSRSGWAEPRGVD
jgi:putative zinc finger protein